MENGMRELYIVRHGETEGESSVRLYGRTDVGLSAAGRGQMRRTGAALAGVAFDAVIVSPLRRSRDSAAVILDGRGPAPRIEPEFTEIDFGAWEGWTLAEAEARDPENFAARITRGVDFAFPGGESKRAFFARTAGAAARIFNPLPGRTLAVLHKGVIKGALAGLLGRPIETFNTHCIELGSIHILRGDDAWQLAADNDTQHLGDTRIPSSG
jgi:broad specificity phosphatase PhoE